MAQACRRIEVADAEGGPAATAPAHRQLDLEPCGFEHFHRGDADVRFVIAHKGVVPQHHPAARRELSRGPAGEPMIKPLPGVMRQRPLPRQA